MKKLGPNIDFFLAELTGDQDQARINFRAHQVRSRYKSVMESVYKQNAALFLKHTNNVYIMNKNDVRTLIVYVDESIFAADLNAQRELIKLKFLEQFGEAVEEFEIYVSRGRYKNNHPFNLDLQQDSTSAIPSIPLDSTELQYVSNTVSNVDSSDVRESLQKAMTASMKLNKAENGKSS